VAVTLGRIETSTTKSGGVGQVSAIGVERLLPQTVRRAQGLGCAVPAFYRSQHRDRRVAAASGDLGPPEGLGVPANDVNVA
jgi:hypothetical protein